MPSRVRDRPYAPQFKPQLCQKIRTDALGRLPLGPRHGKPCGQGWGGSAWHPNLVVPRQSALSWVQIAINGSNVDRCESLKSVPTRINLREGRRGATPYQGLRCGSGLDAQVVMGRTSKRGV